MMDQRLERAKKRLNSEAFRKLTEHVKYDDLPAKQRALADVIGVEETLKLCEVLGGKCAYIPGSYWFDQREQDRQIREDFETNTESKTTELIALFALFRQRCPSRFRHLWKLSAWKKPISFVLT